MVSLSNAFNKVQKDIVIKRLLEQSVVTGIAEFGEPYMFSSFVFKRRVITVSLQKKRFRARITGSKCSHWCTFSYKVSTYNILKFIEGTKKFLEIMLTDRGTVKEEKVKSAFKYIAQFKGLDITKLEDNYLLIVEKNAVSGWFNSMPLISYV